jgi:hypothetical protein
VERRENGWVGVEPAGIGRHPAADRRCAPRVWLYSSVLIYGHTVENEPFHEGTEALRVNAGGGLITLTTPVSEGQMLVLINKVNGKEEVCRVVSLRSAHLNRVAVVVGFPGLVPDFWT